MSEKLKVKSGQLELVRFSRLTTVSPGTTSASGGVFSLDEFQFVPRVTAKAGVCDGAALSDPVTEKNRGWLLRCIQIHFLSISNPAGVIA